MQSRKNVLRVSCTFLLAVMMGLSSNVFAQNGVNHGQPFQTLQDAVTAEQAARIAADQAEAAIRAAKDKELQDRIDAANTVLDNLAQTVGETQTQLANDVSALNAQISDLQAQIDALSSSTDNADQIADLQSQIDDLGAALASKQDILDGPGDCGAGSSLRVIYPDGGYLCQMDQSGFSLKRVTHFTGIAPGAPRVIRIACPPGYRAISAGWDKGRYYHNLSFYLPGNLDIISSYLLSPTTWLIQAAVNQNVAKRTVYLRSYVQCQM